VSLCTWVHPNGSAVITTDVVAAGSVTLDALAPLTIATPTGQDSGTASPTGQVFNAFQAVGAFMLSHGAARYNSVCFGLAYYTPKPYCVGVVSHQCVNVGSAAVRSEVK
jgi:hypothetical protein